MARVLLGKARNTEYDVDTVTPPLGAMYIASVLRAAGHHVTLFDCGDAYDPAAFRRSLVAFRPDVVGLSAITIEGRVMERMATDARAVLPDVPIMVGGPHASAYPERCARHPAIDYVALGEGERTAVELVAALARGEQEPREIAGLVFEDGAGELVWTTEREGIEDVDSIPFPAWDLVDVDFYANRRSMSGMGKRPYMSVFTSRGCPFKCTYCHETQGKRFRARSPANVLAELTELRARYGIRDFEFIDDIFNFNKTRMLGILDGIIASGDQPTLHFPNALRTDLLDAEQIRLLRRAGTQGLCVAVETATERLQKLSKKYLDIEKVRANIELAADEGMYVRGFFMLGFPTETYDEGLKTVEFAAKSALHEALFHIVTPFGGTTLFDIYQEMLQKKGILSLEFDQIGFMKDGINMSAMTDAELMSLRSDGYRRFYMSPTRIARVFWRHPSWRAILQGSTRVVHYVRHRVEHDPAAAAPIAPHTDRIGTPAPRRPKRVADRKKHLPIAGA